MQPTGPDAHHLAPEYLVPGESNAGLFRFDINCWYGFIPEYFIIF